jgi:acyl-coenzyme A synthetase/AMP-(fatty) acid ligase
MTTSEPERFIIDRDLPALSQQGLVNLVRTDSYSPILRTSSLPEIIAHILKAFVCELNITILDHRFTDPELDALEIDSEAINQRVSVNTSSLPNNYPEIIDAAENSRTGCLNLYTSGTSGTPRCVKHRFSTLARAVKKSAHHRADIWGLTYSPCHMAGVQVLLQACLNGNRIINLSGLSREQILSHIVEEGITHLSGTPTFYRLLLPANRRLESVTRVTFGGERFDPSLQQRIQPLFPNAKIRNIYASTEVATLLDSEGETFIVKESLAEVIRVEEDRLLVRKDLLGSFNYKGEWFDTGDRVKVFNHNPLTFTFDQRESEIINVAGHRINPYEIEEVIRSLPYVSDARVFGKPNSVVGTLIAADIVPKTPDCTEAELRAQLTTRLQPFKIPRIIQFVDSIPHSRTGKVKR